MRLLRLAGNCVAFDKTPTFLLGASNFGLNWKSAAMRVFAAAAVLLGLPALALAPACAEPRIQSERFDDWYYRCVTPEAGKGQASPKPQCEVVQIAQAKQGQETVNVLTISVSETVHENKKAAVITILRRRMFICPAASAFPSISKTSLACITATATTPAAGSSTLSTTKPSKP